MKLKKEMFIFIDKTGRGVKNTLPKKHLKSISNQLFDSEEEKSEYLKYLSESEMGDEYETNSFKLIKT